MPIQRIYLVGFMGAGKSTVGRELALKLRWPFVDLDNEIERSEGLSVREIFDKFGEPRFRELERHHLGELSKRDRGVMALGGGTYMEKDNRKVIEETGIAVWLDVTFSQIQERVRPDGSRPLLSDIERAKRLYAERRSVYALAPIRIVTDARLPNEIAEDIIQRVAKL